MLKEMLKKVRTDPKETIRVSIALLKGFLIKVIYKFKNPNVRFGSSFRAYSWPRIAGPGKIIIGNKVSMDINFIRRPAILTHTKDAVVTIGDRCYIGGARISCVDSVMIGNDALLGSSTIIDSDIIPSKDVVINSEWKKQHVRPIRIGAHFWSGTNSYILKGTVINDECVLGAGAVIWDKEVPERSLLMGNPARKIGVTRF